MFMFEIDPQVLKQMCHVSNSTRLDSWENNHLLKKGPISRSIIADIDQEPIAISNIPHHDININIVCPSPLTSIAKCDAEV